MPLTIGTTYHGFLLKKEEEIGDVRGTAYLFEHEKSGARLFYIQNTDNNKVFSISFKTPPTNDCGTPHILEHSVLCGSKKYTAKDPFNELAKGSLNTFLNALTYPDKTMYPVASCNEDDFHNLMDVYLDAVFYPNIYNKKEIFMQEGWRYILNSETDTLEVTGVVYNEMKGALSDPESLLSGVISRNLFGESTYGFESGGDPSAIPSLTYEDFLDFHTTYYHPSNGYLYLYGDLDLDRALEHINIAYLQDFERSSCLPEILEVATLPKADIQKETYPAEEGGEDTEKGYLAYSVNVGKCTDEALGLALQMLSYVLLETNASPLKIALQDAGICDEAEGWFDTSTYEMVFSIIGKNAAENQERKFVEIIENTLRRIANEGVDTELLNSSIRRMEFLLKEEDYGSTPKGLVYGMRLMGRWLYGEDPFESLRMIETLEKIKSPDFSWSALVNEVLLQNQKKTILVFTPEIGKRQREEDALKEALAKRKAAFTAKDLEKLQEETRKLELFQKTEESPEVLAQIPLLQLSQISPDPLPIVYTNGTLGGTKFLYAPMPSNGILYVKLHFNTECVPQHLLPYVGLLSEVLGKLDTIKHSYQELPLLLNRYFGGISFHTDVFNKSTTEYCSYVTVSGKLLKEDLSMGMKLIEDLLLTTKYNTLGSLKKIVKAARIKGENYMQSNGHLVGIYHCLAHLTEGGRLNETMSGLTFFHFICEIDARLSTNPETVIQNLKEAASFLFTKENCRVSFGCEEGDRKEVENALTGICHCLPIKAGEKQHYAFELEESKNAITANSAVQYNILAANYNRLDYDYHGSMQVLKTILNLEYIWGKIRVQGGAYGGGCNFNQNGLCYFYSYRDPNLVETYTVYKELWQDLEKFQASDRELTKYILGTINRFDQPKTNKELLSDAIQKDFRDIDENFEKMERTQILQTTGKDIVHYAAMLKGIGSVENYCTVGNEQKIQATNAFFQRIEKMIP